MIQLYEVARVITSQRQKKRFPGGWGESMGRVPFWNDNKVLEIHCGGV
jgi:hypothetical protein